MNIVTRALEKGDKCHIRLNDSQTIADVTYVGETDVVGKKCLLFSNGVAQHVINPSYIAQIIRKTQGANHDTQKHPEGITFSETSNT